MCSQVHFLAVCCNLQYITSSLLFGGAMGASASCPCVLKRGVKGGQAPSHVQNQTCVHAPLPAPARSCSSFSCSSWTVCFMIFMLVCLHLRICVRTTVTKVDLTNWRTKKNNYFDETFNIFNTWNKCKRS